MTSLGILPAAGHGSLNILIIQASRKKLFSSFPHLSSFKYLINAERGWGTLLPKPAVVDLAWERIYLCLQMRPKK